MSLMPTSSVKSDGSLFLGWDDPAFPVAPIAPVITLTAPTVGAKATDKAAAPEAAGRPASLSGHERATFEEFGTCYEIGQAKGRRTIFCLVCRRESFNPDDVDRLYCGGCNRFHADRQRAWEAGILAEGRTDLNGAPGQQAKRG